MTKKKAKIPDTDIGNNEYDILRFNISEDIENFIADVLDFHKQGNDGKSSVELAKQKMIR